MERIFRPHSIAELDRIVRDNHTALTFVAGATDLLVQRQHWGEAQNLVDLLAVRELNEQLEVSGDLVRIGAAVPLCRIIAHPILQQRLPLLIEACRQIGSVQIQNRATLGGNIANASPAGDSLPVLSVLEAEIWIGPQNNGEFEKLKIDQVMLNPGETSLKDNRYIAHISIPVPRNENQFWYFRKLGQRKALAISKVSLAVLGWKRGGLIEQIRIAPGSVNPQIRRAQATESVLNNQMLSTDLMNHAAQVLAEEIKPISDIRSTAGYRRSVCVGLLREALFRCAAQGDS